MSGYQTAANPSIIVGGWTALCLINIRYSSVVTIANLILTFWRIWAHPARCSEQWMAVIFQAGESFHKAAAICSERLHDFVIATMWSTGFFWGRQRQEQWFFILAWRVMQENYSAAASIPPWTSAWQPNRWSAGLLTLKLSSVLFTLADWYIMLIQMENVEQRP